MPHHRIHRGVSRILFGKPYTAVHKALDLPIVFYARKHRRYLHDPISSAMVGAAVSDDAMRGILAAWLHILTDEASSRDMAVRLSLEAGISVEQAVRELARLKRRLKKYGKRSRRKRRTRRRTG